MFFGCKLSLLLFIVVVVIVVVVVAVLVIIFDILVCENRCRCRRHKLLTNVDVQITAGTDSPPKYRTSKPDTVSTEVSDASSKHFQLLQKYFFQGKSRPHVLRYSNNSNPYAIYRIFLHLLVFC